MTGAKQQMVIDWIVAQGEGYTLTTWAIDDIVLSLRVSPSTVRRAMKVLQAEGSMTGNVYTTRQYIPPEEIATLIDDVIGTFITDKWYERAARVFHATQETLYQCLVCSLNHGFIKQQSGGQHGWFLRRSFVPGMA